jgi:TonB family protein
MKKSILLASALIAAVFANSASAYSPKTTAQQLTPAPKLVPAKIVTPSGLPESFSRSIVNVEFSLDASGQPKDVKVLSNADRNVKEQVVKAFKQWKFEPIAAQPGAETPRFVLPLDIVPEV